MDGNCKGCRLYSKSLQRCLKGFVSPPTLRNVIEVMKSMGPGYICGLNEHKGQAIRICYKRLRA